MSRRGGALATRTQCKTDHPVGERQRFKFGQKFKLIKSRTERLSTFPFPIEAAPIVARRNAITSYRVVMIQGGGTSVIGRQANTLANDEPTYCGWRRQFICKRAGKSRSRSRSRRSNGNNNNNTVNVSCAEGTLNCNLWAATCKRVRVVSYLSLSSIAANFLPTSSNVGRHSFKQSRARARAREEPKGVSGSGVLVGHVLI